MTLFAIHSHSLSFLYMEKVPIHCFLCKIYLDKSFSSKSREAGAKRVHFTAYARIKQTKNRRKGNQPKPTSRLQLMCAIWMNVQYVHAALSARRAWPSFSCRCVSTGEACQTPGSPFQRCQRTFQVLSGARIENKGGKNKGGEGVFVVSTKAKGSLQKWQKAMDTAHSLHMLYLCNF